LKEDCMWRMVLGALFIALALPVSAQNRPTLDDQIVGAFSVSNPLPPCGLKSAINRLAQKTQVLAGFEETRDCVGLGTSDGGNQNLAGMTVRQALDYLLALAPTYAWRELDRVAVVRPAVAWNDPRDALNVYMAPFSVMNVDLKIALYALLHMSVSDASEPPRPPARSVSATFSGGTMLDALNALVRAHQAADWNVGLIFHTSPIFGEDPNPTVMIMMTTFDLAGISVGTSLGRLYGATGGGVFTPR
jgi:hypothetical protein